jgi:pumilio family protein 6
VSEAKRIWNDLRKKSNTPEQNRAHMDRLVPLVRGRAAELALQHDASRVVQAAIQFGTVEERRSILGELCQKREAAAGAPAPSSSSSATTSSCFVELCRSQYAHFVALKAIQYCHGDKECAEAIARALRSHVAKLATHASGCTVVELALQKLPTRLAAPLRQEFYGPHFALLASDAAAARDQGGKAVPALASPALAADPDRRRAAVEHVRALVNKGLEKQQLLRLGFYQGLLDELLQAIPPEEVRAMAGTTASGVADSCVHVASTRAGARAVATLVAYGTARDRKRVAKGLKGYARAGLLHRDAYLAVLRLVQLTDDTVSIHKGVLQELLAPPPAPSAAGAPEVPAAGSEEAKGAAAPPPPPPSPLLELALSDTASKLFLLLLADGEGARNRFLDPYERSVLFPDPRVSEEGTGGGERVPTSRKDPEVRRAELLRPLLPPLVDLCARHPGELLRSPPGGRVVVQLYSHLRRRQQLGGGGGGGTEEAAAAEAARIRLVRSLVDACAASLLPAPSEDEGGPEGGGGGGGGIVSLFEDRCGHLAVKNLILVDAASRQGGGGNDDEEDDGGCFASQLFARVCADGGTSTGNDRGGGFLAVAGSNRGAFVAASLCKVPGLRPAALARVRACRERLRRLAGAGEGGPTAGYAALLNELAAGGGEFAKK